MAPCTMAWIQQAKDQIEWIHHAPILPVILDVPLRAFGQVIFCNSPVSGAGMLGALFYADSWLAVLAIVGSVVGTLTGHVGQVSQLSGGLAGYNGVLVGCGFATFLKFTEWTWQPVVATSLASVASVIVATAMTARSKIPMWTFPFNIVLMCTLMHTLPFDNSSVPDDGGLELNIRDLLMAVPIGVSQVFVVSNWISGVIVIISLAVYSPSLSASCVLGSLLGISTAVAIQVDPSAIASGLCGYNSALTACAVCTFFEPTKEALVLLTLSSTLTQVLASGLSRAAMFLKIPVGTLPFCIAATVSYMLLGQVKGCKLLSGDAEEQHKAEASVDYPDLEHMASVVGSPIAFESKCPSAEHPGAQETAMGIAIDMLSEINVDFECHNERSPLSPNFPGKSRRKTKDLSVQTRARS